MFVIFVLFESFPERVLQGKISIYKSFYKFCNLRNNSSSSCISCSYIYLCLTQMTTATFGKGDGYGGDSHGGYGGYGDHGKGKGDDYGHGGGGGYGGGTACIVKGSYCQCHYCKCEHGFLHCGKGKDGYGGHKG